MEDVRENFYQEEHDKLLDQYNELKEEHSELYDKYIRMAADFDNYKKNIAKEKERILKYSGENILFSLLEVMDNFELAEKNNDLTEGSKLVMNQVKKILDVNDVKKIDNDIFDENYHEAISSVSLENEYNMKIVDVLLNGYMFKDKVLRYSKVVVNVKQNSDN